MEIEQSASTLSRIISRLLDPFGRKSLFRDLCDRFRPSHAPGLVKSAVGIVDFWDKAHATSSHLWISGTPPREIYGRLKVEKLLASRSLSVLNVGVGEGYCEFDLTKKKHSVDSLDISQVALNRVGKVIGAGFLSASLLPLNKYDLILHHLVAQHMTHKDLEIQLVNLINSLKDDGLIAMQFASSAKIKNFVESDADPVVVMSGGVLRSKKFIEEIVNQNGGKAIAFYENEIWANSDCQYLSVHIAKITT